jgi:hypothetical protein
MGKYYKFKDKVSGVIRPVLPTDFIIKDDDLMWDDTDAVYDAGVVEFSHDKIAWRELGIFLPDDGKMSALVGKYAYRLRVKYNCKWSEYLVTEAKKVIAEVVQKPKVTPKKKK